MSRLISRGLIVAGVIAAMLVPATAFAGDSPSTSRRPEGVAVRGDSAIFQAGLGARQANPLVRVDGRACAPGGACKVVCKVGRVASVAASIGFGAVGNTVTGEARCNGVAVATAGPVADPGGGLIATAGPVFGAEVAGPATCVGVPGVMAAPVSSWVIWCTF